MQIINQLSTIHNPSFISDPLQSDLNVVFLSDSGSLGAPFVCVGDAASGKWLETFTLWQVSKSLSRLALACPFLGPAPESSIYASAERANLAGVWLAKWFAARSGLAFSPGARPLLCGRNWPGPDSWVAMGLRVDLELQSAGFVLAKRGGASPTSSLDLVPPAFLRGYNAGSAAAFSAGIDRVMAGFGGGLSVAAA